MLDEDFSQQTRPQPSASCLLLRRSLLPSDRIFDERYPIFFNDVQLARWLARSRYVLWVTPSAQVVHAAHASTRMLGRTGKRQYLGSLVRMLMEYGAAIQGVAIPRDRVRAEHPDLFSQAPRCARLLGALEGAFGRRRTASRRMQLRNERSGCATHPAEHGAHKGAPEKGVQESLRVGGEIVWARVARLSARRRRVFIFLSPPLSNSGAPLILMEIVREFASRYGSESVRLLAPTGQPTHSSQSRRVESRRNVPRRY